MQPVNDDMDNLFRQAAENYPLNTQGADFDKLLQRMDAAGDATAPQKENRRRYGWLLLLLLLPLPFLCRHYYGPGLEDKLPPTVVQQPITSPEQRDAVSHSGSDASKPGNSAFSDPQITITANDPATADGSIASDNLTHTTEPGNDAALQEKSSGEERSLLQGNKTQSTIVTSTTTAKSVKKIPSNNGRLYAHTDNERSNDDAGKKDSDSGSANKIDKAREDNYLSKEKKSASVTALPDSLLKRDNATQRNNQPTDTVKNTIAQQATAKDSTATNVASIIKKQKEPDKKEKPYLYAGIVCGIDYSAVKSKQTAGTGYNTGVVAGYRFGRHWAVETGLLWDHKKYRAEGKYIDTAGLGIAMHTQVFNAKGSCGILEIPLTVQYHFNSKGRSHWYAAAGLSSYLIKKEEYYYVGKRYNMVYYAEKEYTNSTKNWFSVLQVGGGYQWQFGKRSSLRAEPYVKLPLSKIGIANLPLSSAGINIGYIRPL